VGSFLDQMAGQIYAGFKGKLYSGVIRRMEGGAGNDPHGRPLGRAPAFYRCEGFRDDYSDRQRADAGIPQTSVRINIFGASIDPATKPRLDDLVRLDPPGGPEWYKLKARIGTDPAKALWQCEAQAAPAPEDAP
jgi:hypothetical protein